MHFGFSGTAGSVRQSDTLEEYSAKVEKIKHYIREGHIFQTVLSQRWILETKQKRI